MNLQPPAPRIYEGTDISIHSIFYTIQGEGPFAGRPAVFVRLYGCNLQCPGCDTDYTSIEQIFYPDNEVDGIIRKFKAPGDPLIVITGGEPLRQPIGSFIRALQVHRCTVQIETNGTLPLPGWPVNIECLWHLVDIVCSPKTGKVNKILQPFITAYKYVLSSDSVSEDDGLPLKALGHPAEPVLARPPKDFPLHRIYLQPMDPDPEGNNLRACIQSCFKFGYALSLQQHKIIGVP